jgi:predicted CXXCH cytochrome family protein
MRARARWWIAVSGAIVGLAAVGAVLFAATKLEENDAFCASCHTEPETTYVARSVEARFGKPVDLASAHAAVPEAVRCIDCHSDEGARGRLGALMLGAEDAARWVSGMARQPGITTAPLSDGHCLKCHAPVLTNESFDGHYHRLMPRWRVVAAEQGTPYAGCVGCHSSHTTDGSAQAEYVRQQRAQQVCDQCHRAMDVR